MRNEIKCVPQEKVMRLVSELEELRKAKLCGGKITTKTAKTLGRLNAVECRFIWRRVLKGKGLPISMRRPRWMWDWGAHARKMFVERIEVVKDMLLRNEGCKIDMREEEWDIHLVRCIGRLGVGSGGSEEREEGKGRGRRRCGSTSSWRRARSGYGK